jgi:hypothetical protein
MHTENTVPKYQYAEDTTPDGAITISADFGEIVHIHCEDEVHRTTYACELRRLLNTSNQYGGGDAALEVVGTYLGASVRILLSLP